MDVIDLLAGGAWHESWHTLYAVLGPALYLLVCMRVC
jgi:hypothetical protein